MSAGEDGSGSLLAVAVLAASALIACAWITAAAVLPAHARARGAADAAALAAADALAGWSLDEPCAVAARVAVANGARIASCELSGPTALVRVTVAAAGFTIGVAARAGPPREGPLPGG